jgi:hypothetical protein
MEATPALYKTTGQFDSKRAMRLSRIALALYGIGDTMLQPRFVAGLHRVSN